MKKILALVLVISISILAFTIPVYAYTGHAEDGDTLKFKGATSGNAFGDLLDWNGIVFGNVNNVIDVEGTLAVGGNFNSNTGFSANSGAYGADPASTEDVAYLVGGNVNISGYGSVWGQTVIGNAEGNTYHLSNITPSATTNGKFTVADSTGYFADALTTVNAVRTAIAALPANGVYEAAYGTYTFAGDPDAETIVYNVSDANFPSYLFDFTIKDGQTVIVNLTADAKINFKYGGIRINGNSEPDYLRKYNRNIILNVVNSNEIEMTSCELYGIVLAPATNLIGKGSNICGTSILKNLTGSNGFELHIGSNDTFIPVVKVSNEVATTSNDTVITNETNSSIDNIRIDVPRKMAVVFEDGSIYYGGEMKEITFGQEYLFQMCTVNWDNGLYDENGNGLRGTVVYRMKVVHLKEFNTLKASVAGNSRYTVKGIDIIDNEAKTIIINGDDRNAHLETDVNNFFMAYRFHFGHGDYNKQTGIVGVISTPLESLSVNLPLGATITCDAYINYEKMISAKVFIENSNYDNVYLTSVNDYTWDY